jgi:hypothetical protein
MTGRAQHGKDSVAGVLVAEFGFKAFAFADALKEIVYTLNPYFEQRDDAYRIQDIVQEGGWDYAKQNPEVRRLLQVMGTEAGRDILGENVWVNTLGRKVSAFLKETGTPIYAARIVITDVRFPNEVAWLQENGGDLWKVVRPGFDNKVDAHPSEQYVDGFDEDLTLVNNTNLPGLESLARMVAAHELESEFYRESSVNG